MTKAPRLFVDENSHANDKPKESEIQNIIITSALGKQPLGALASYDSICVYTGFRNDQDIWVESPYVKVIYERDFDEKDQPIRVSESYFPVAHIRSLTIIYKPKEKKKKPLISIKLEREKS